MLLRSTAGGRGKSGANPARSRHCERALMRRCSHWGADGSPGRRGAEPEARRPDSGRSPYDPRGRGGSMTTRLRRTALPVALVLLALAAAPAAAAAASHRQPARGGHLRTRSSTARSSPTPIARRRRPMASRVPCDGTNNGRSARADRHRRAGRRLEGRRLRWDAELVHARSAATTTRSSRSGQRRSTDTHYLAFWLNWKFADLAAAASRSSRVTTSCSRIRSSAVEGASPQRSDHGDHRRRA